MCRISAQITSQDVPLLILSTQSEGELRQQLPLSPTDYVLQVSEPGDLSQAYEH